MILITGGAGYIGSHVAKELLVAGKNIIILDNLSTGHTETIESLKQIAGSITNLSNLEFILGDTGDHETVSQIMNCYPITAVIHLAAFSQVGESMQFPGKYFKNNVANTINILDCMANSGIKNIVFSSTAAVYGEPAQIPIKEDQAPNPKNVYGASKLMMESIFQWYTEIYGIDYVALRYFNAAGADSSGLIGEWHEPETHLIPIILDNVLGKRKTLTVYGNDYSTMDGTCIRDYIHVTDLAIAHICALEGLQRGMGTRIFNLGNGYGFSVKEVIKATEEVLDIEIAYDIGKRRSGDPAILVACSDKIKRELSWEPQISNLKDIIKSAYIWHKKLSEK